MSNPTPENEALVDVLRERAPRPLTIEEIARFLRLESFDRRAMRAALEGLVGSRALRRIGKTRYQWQPVVQRARATKPAGIAARAGGVRRRAAAGQGAVLEGRYARVRGGFGFADIPGRARDVLIPEGEEGEAMHGDRVAIEISRTDQRGRRALGRVVEVVERSREHVVGTLQRRGQRWLVVPEDELLPPVELASPPRPGETPGTAEATRLEGRIALVRLTRPPSPGRAAGGILERVLGDAEDAEVQFLMIAHEHGLRLEHPPEAEAEARAARPVRLTAERLDLRDVPFVTIDPETARDFDDAVALDELGLGRVRLRVAIADVSHYVRPGTGLDAEAAKRGTSVYFPDRAIPMLPEALSGDLCSLRPDADRPALVVEIVLDGRGRRREVQFHAALIRSRARLTYDEVAAVLSDAETPAIGARREALAPLLPQLRRMLDLMRVLFRARLALGSLDLDLPEAMVDLSQEGRSIGIRLFRRNDAHRIIEELMLQANCAVAEGLESQGVPFPYRIHEPPGEDSIEELNEQLGPFGFSMRPKGQVEPADVQRLLARFEGHRLARVLTRQVLRSLAQARYSTRNAGHFGLAFPTYCHFTSPIRRYPDLLVHRQLRRVLAGDIAAARGEGEALERASRHSSFLERRAMEAERAMLDLKKAEFMLDHLLEPLPATVVAVGRFGAFVELDDYPIEGHLATAEGAGRGRRRLQMGDRLLVEATNVSVRQRRIELSVLRTL